MKFLEQAKLLDKVKLAGWIPNDKITEYLNELKLLVIPSYTENMPNIILEAMACGTPVLANAVGGIPDVITDGINGFLMADNSPECIAENIIRALNYPNLQQISDNASEFVRKEFSLGKAVDKYRHALNELAR
jgi:glycosyltransferase involved in cell wall biosynthesis